MRPYNIPKGRRNQTRRGQSKRVKFEHPVLRLFSIFMVMGIGVALAGMIALKLYLISLPPIKNLNTLKPNIVTTFCASDGQVIKTFAAYTFANVELKEVPKQLVQALIATEDKRFFEQKANGSYPSRVGAFPILCVPSNRRGGGGQDFKGDKSAFHAGKPPIFVRIPLAKQKRI